MSSVNITVRRILEVGIVPIDGRAAACQDDAFHGRRAVDLLQDVAGARLGRRDQFFLRIGHIELEGRCRVENHLAARHGLGIGTLIHEIGFEVGHRSGSLGGDLIEILEFPGILGVTHRGMYGKSFLQQLLDDPSGHIAGGARDHHGGMRVDRGHGRCPSFIA